MTGAALQPCTRIDCANTRKPLHVLDFAEIIVRRLPEMKIARPLSVRFSNVKRMEFKRTLRHNQTYRSVSCGHTSKTGRMKRKRFSEPYGRANSFKSRVLRTKPFTSCGDVAWRPSKSAPENKTVAVKPKRTIPAREGFRQEAQ